MKRFLFIILSLAVACSCFASCGGSSGGGISYNGQYVDAEGDERVQTLANALSNVTYDTLKTEKVTSLLGAGFSFSSGVTNEEESDDYDYDDVKIRVDYNGNDLSAIDYETTSKESLQGDAEIRNLYMYSYIKELKNREGLYMDSPYMLTHNADLPDTSRARIKTSVLGEYVDEYLEKTDFGTLTGKADKTEKCEKKNYTVFKFTLDSYVEESEKEERPDVRVNVEQAVLYIAVDGETRIKGITAVLRYSASDDGYNKTTEASVKVTTGTITVKANAKMGDVTSKKYTGYSVTIDTKEDLKKIKNMMGM